MKRNLIAETIIRRNLKKFTKPGINSPIVVYATLVVSELGLHVRTIVSGGKLTIDQSY